MKDEPRPTVLLYQVFYVHKVNQNIPFIKVFLFYCERPYIDEIILRLPDLIIQYIINRYSSNSTVLFLDLITKSKVCVFYRPAHKTSVGPGNSARVHRQFTNLSQRLLGIHLFQWFRCWRCYRSLPRSWSANVSLVLNFCTRVLLMTYICTTSFAE